MVTVNAVAVILYIQVYVYRKNNNKMVCRGGGLSYWTMTGIPLWPHGNPAVRHRFLDVSVGDVAAAVFKMTRKNTCYFSFFVRFDLHVAVEKKQAKEMRISSSNSNNNSAIVSVQLVALLLYWWVGGGIPFYRWHPTRTLVVIAATVVATVTAALRTTHVRAPKSVSVRARVLRDGSRHRRCRRRRRVKPIFVFCCFGKLFVLLFDFRIWFLSPRSLCLILFLSSVICLCVCVCMCCDVRARLLKASKSLPKKKNGQNIVGGRREDDDRQG